MASDAALWEALGGRFDLRMLCGLFLEHDNEGTTLPADLLGTLSQRGIRLDLDIYYMADADDPSG